MKALEEENRELRRANEILKSAAAFFGAELDRRPSNDPLCRRASASFRGVEPICSVLRIAPSTADFSGPFHPLVSIAVSVKILILES